LISSAVWALDCGNKGGKIEIKMKETRIHRKLIKISSRKINIYKEFLRKWNYVSKWNY
jgi:hypothetical protein